MHSIGEQIKGLVWWSSFKEIVVLWYIKMVIQWYQYIGYCDILYSGKVWRIDFFQAFGERKFGELKRSSANRLFIDLDGFSLVNHGQFAKFTKLSCYMVNYIGASIYTNFGGWCTILNDFYCITVVIKIFTT